MTKGADPHVCDKKKHNAMYEAVKAKHFAVIDLLRSATAKLEDDDLKIANILCRHAALGELDELKAWQAGGANLNAEDYRVCQKLVVPAGCL